MEFEERRGGSTQNGRADQEGADHPGLDHARERRRKRDIWVKSLSWIAAVGWMVMLSALVVFERAKPHYEQFFLSRDFRYRRDPNVFWDNTLVDILFLLMLAGIGISAVGLYINYKRNRRKTDRIRFSLVVLLLASLAGSIIYLLR